MENKIDHEIGVEVPTIEENDGRVLQLDTENKEFFQAIDLINKTNRSVFITGKAGTGKTTFLKYLTKNTHKECVVVAFTGIAALNAGGQTINSFFKIDPHKTPYLPDDKRLQTKSPVVDDGQHIKEHLQYSNNVISLIESMEMLVIDEVSMLRADYVDLIDKILRSYRKNKEDVPFGGVQIILIGDVFQLPPIKGEEWIILSKYYSNPFFFNSQAYKDINPIYIELKKIYRQTEISFINMLNRIRIAEPTGKDIDTLNRGISPITENMFENGFIVLCSTNKQVSEINTKRLNSINGELRTYIGSVEDEFPTSQMKAEKSLELKEESQIMFLVNTKSFVNGQIGTIVSFGDDIIVASIRDSKGNLRLINVEKYTWYYQVYVIDSKTKKISKEIKGSYTQFPVKLAWAITVHKSQGLTFDRVAINIKDFSPPGLVYVALSRCTSFNGLVISNPIPRSYIQTEPVVIEFAKKETPDTMIVDIIDQEYADELYKSSLKLYQSGEFDEAYDTFLLALKHRNDIGQDYLRHFFKNEYRRYSVFSLKSRVYSSIIRIRERSIISKFFQISELRDNLNMSSRENADLKEEKIAMVEKFDFQEHEISNMLDEQLNKVDALTAQINALIENNKRLKDLTNQYKNEVDSAKENIVRLNDRLEKIIKQNNQLTEVLMDTQSENKRLLKLSWWDLLKGNR